MPKPKINYKKNLFGIRKWQYARLGDINLMCEISILSSCTLLGSYRPCRKHLTWCIEILMLRWDDIQYIDFYSAIEVIKNNRKLFNDSLRFSFNKDYIRQLISRK